MIFYTILRASRRPLNCQRVVLGKKVAVSGPQVGTGGWRKNRHAARGGAGVVITCSRFGHWHGVQGAAFYKVAIAQMPFKIRRHCGLTFKLGGQPGPRKAAVGFREPARCKDGFWPKPAGLRAPATKGRTSYPPWQCARRVWPGAGVPNVAPALLPASALGLLKHFGALLKSQHSSSFGGGFLIQSMPIG